MLVRDHSPHYFFVSYLVVPESQFWRQRLASNPRTALKRCGVLEQHRMKKKKFLRSFDLNDNGIGGTLPNYLTALLLSAWDLNHSLNSKPVCQKQLKISSEFFAILPARRHKKNTNL